MKFLRLSAVIFTLGCLPSAALAVTPPAQTSTQTTAILPTQFGGWQLQGAIQTSKDPAVADPTNAGVLREYQFTEVASATYTRDDGRTLKVRAARFADTSGAFGAYTFYVQPEMNREKIGDQGASLGQRVLFYRGPVLVDASFSQESVMAGAELRELAGDLPRASGNTGNLPTFLEFMPHMGYVAQTQKYVEGPAALSALAAPVAADLVDFGASSEVTLGRYNTSSGEVTLMLISYPTPQLAADHLKRIDAAHQIRRTQADVSSIAGSGEFFDKRSGPIVAVVSGPAAESDARALLGAVNWEASVTWNTPTGNQEVKNLTSLVLNIVLLCAIIGAFAVIAGVAFGGVRVLMKRLYPDKVFDRPEQMEFISLHLTETVVKGMPETVVEDIVVVESTAETGAERGGAGPENPV